MITFGSLFSGIGGFEKGFEDAGLVCQWQVEIDPDCDKILSHHWPNVKRYKDVRDVGKHNLAAVDVICFGSPCQDLSVAGNRQGLAGSKSGLFFDAIRVVKELRPAIAVWENVPGAFSSNSGYDFLAVLNSFRECGARDIAWATLDAQYFRVAQRRRRVFVVADFRGERAGEILFEPEGVCWNPAESRKERAQDSIRIAASLTANYGKQLDNSDRNGGPPNMIYQEAQYGVEAYDNAGTLRHGRIPEHQMVIAGTMKSNGDAHSGFEFGDGLVPMAINISASQPRCDNVPVTLSAKHHGGCQQNLVAATLNSGGNSDGFRTEPGEHLVAFGWNKSESQTMRIDGETTDALQSSPTSNPAIAFATQQTPKGFSEDVCPTLQIPSPSGGGQPHAVKQGSGVRRLTPLECERLQGFPDGWTATDASGSPVSDSARYRMLGNAVCVAVARWIGQRIIASL